MTRYFFDKESPFREDGEQYCLFAMVDSLYYWKIGGNMNIQTRTATISTFSSGFVSAKILDEHTGIPEIDLPELRKQFGSFAYFIERAVNGFKSYLSWISPGPQSSVIPWQIPLS